MNMISEKNAQDKFKELLKPKDQREKIELDAMLFAAPYLGIIQDKMREDGIKRKELAEKIGTSTSYITQLLNTNKMLNFTVLARIAEVLELNFQVNRKPRSSKYTIHKKSM